MPPSSLHKDWTKPNPEWHTLHALRNPRVRNVFVAIANEKAVRFVYALNIDLLIRRALRRPTCVKARSARVFPSARIINILGRSSAISIGACTVVRGELLTFAHGGSIEIGDWCYIGANSRIWSGARVQIGDRVMIAHNVDIFDNLTHPIDPEARHRQFREMYEVGHPRDIDLEDEPVVLEEDAWVGAGACILKGTTIGRGAIVAARSVVTKDVAPFSIVAGNPAVVVRAVPRNPSV